MLQRKIACRLSMTPLRCPEETGAASNGFQHMVCGAFSRSFRISRLDGFHDLAVLLD
jgi:hypothetical protein